MATACCSDGLDEPIRKTGFWTRFWTPQFSTTPPKPFLLSFSTHLGDQTLARSIWKRSQLLDAFFRLAQGLIWHFEHPGTTPVVRALSVVLGTLCFQRQKTHECEGKPQQRTNRNSRSWTRVSSETDHGPDWSCNTLQLTGQPGCDTGGTFQT